MIYRLKYAKSESNFDADFEHPTLQGALLIAIIPRALPWAKSFCPFRACCLRALPWAKSFWAFSPYLNHPAKVMNPSSCPLLSEHEDDDLNGYDAQEHGEWVNIGVAH